VGEYHVQADFALLSSSDESPIRVGKRWYRGEIIIHKDAGYHLEVINELDLEFYLQGIMKQEISPQWPEACLKAQAIVARSYALYERQRNADSLFDLKSTVESQAYLGLDGEDPLTNEAVMNTRHMILVNNGQPLPAFYHACCGGHTEAAENIFGNYPALPGVPCRFCRDAPYYKWEVSFSDFEIRNFLLRSGMKVGPVRSLQLIGQTSSGRVREVAVKHTLGNTTMSAKSLRQIIGYDRLPSLLFKIDTIEKGKGSYRQRVFSFTGRGWGHGAGLCQWGARKMAEQGAGYEEILSTYYPLASLSKLK
jgi:stage II sporulation protein D